MSKKSPRNSEREIIHSLLLSLRVQEFLEVYVLNPSDFENKEKFIVCVNFWYKQLAPFVGNDTRSQR